MHDSKSQHFKGLHKNCNKNCIHTVVSHSRRKVSKESFKFSEIYLQNLARIKEAVKGYQEKCHNLFDVGEKIADIPIALFYLQNHGRLYY